MVRVVVLVFFSLFLLSCTADQEAPRELPEGFSILNHYSERNNVTSKISDLTCDSESRTLVFTLTNLDDVVWSLDRSLSEEETMSKNVRFLLNNEVLNSVRGDALIVDEETQETFSMTPSEDCGTDLLLPQESVTCEAGPVPLEDANQLRIDVQGKDDRVTFTC